MNDARKTAAAALAAALVLCGCGSWQTPKVTIQNQTAAALERIVIKGAGVERAVDSIGAGQSVTVDIQPSQAGGLDIEIPTPVRLIAAKNIGYIEPKGGYHLYLTVTRDYNLETRLGLDGLDAGPAQ